MTGPSEGLCSVRRSRLHLSAGGDIDFIDDRDEEVRQNPKKYPRRLSTSSRKISNPQIGTTLLPSDFKKTTDEENNEPLNDLIADVTHWNAPSSEQGHGIALSLYEKNPITSEHAGSPIADCYGLIARRNSCVMAMADGVNWGEKAKIASCSAVQASLEYLTRALLRPSKLNLNRTMISYLNNFHPTFRQCSEKLKRGLCKHSEKFLGSSRFYS